MKRELHSWTAQVLKFTVFFFYFQFTFQSSSGQSIRKEFRKLSCPEKRWVIFHPFIAKKAYRITQEARAASKEMAHDPALDGDENGGQVDAFRHAYWMALLSQHICWRKALRLGKAHEKGNYRAFKKGNTEEGILPDSASGAMDLFNNKIGIEIGRTNRHLSPEALKRAVHDSILTGKMEVIRKDSNGDALDCNGNILDPAQYHHQWNIPKCLIKSDYRKE